MMKRFAYSLLGIFVFNFLFLAPAAAQTGDSLLREKLYVHTDKEFYVAGEILWFKVYYTDLLSGKDPELSRYVYAEIINEEGAAVLQATLPVEEAVASGSFYLPVSLGSGNYRLRAYTNWLKNFGAGSFFTKPVVIVNTMRRSGEDSVITGNAPEPYQFGFYPEGGNLLSQVQNRVGLMVRDSLGRGQRYSGQLIEDDSVVITSFSSSRFGLSDFLVMPRSGHSYRMDITLDNGRTISRSLTGISDKGYAIELQETTQGVGLKLKSGRGVNAVGSLVKMSLSNRERLLTLKEATIDAGGSASFFFGKDQLPEGMSLFTVFDSRNQPIAERLFFIPPTQSRNITALPLDPTVGKREKVVIDLKEVQKSSADGELNLSASVFLSDSLAPASFARIDAYMWLTSYLQGNVEDPGFYFSNDPDRKKITDQLLLTQGWRRFAVTDKKREAITYLPEVNGHLVTGKISERKTGKPASHILALLSVEGPPSRFYTARSDEQGRIVFEVKDYYGSNGMIVQPASAGDTLYSITIDAPYFREAEPLFHHPVLLGESNRESLLDRSLSAQLQQIYIGDSLRNFSWPTLSDTLPFYGKQDNRYVLDEYKRFGTMEEVLREYVREIGVGVKEGKPFLKMFNPILHDFFNGNVLVLLDGVPLHDPSSIFRYDPMKVEKLDIIQDRYVMGTALFNGIASFVTYKKKFDAYDLNPGMYAIDYAGLQLQREFYSPDYGISADKDSRLPDFRNTLYWQPDIRWGKDKAPELSFYTGDQPGRYRIVVQGMDKNGNFVSSESYFDVQ